MGSVIPCGGLIIVVVGCSGVVDVEMVSAGDFGALVGTVSLLLTTVAGDVVKKSAVSSWGCLRECHSFSCCCVVGSPVVPVASVVVVEWDGCSVSIEHGNGMVQVFGAFVNPHGTIIVERFAKLFGLVKVGCTETVASLEAFAGSLCQFLGFIGAGVQQVSTLAAQVLTFCSGLDCLFHVDLAKAVFHEVLGGLVLFGKGN